MNHLQITPGSTHSLKLLEDISEKIINFHYLLNRFHNYENCTFQQEPLLSDVSKTITKNSAEWIMKR